MFGWQQPQGGTVSLGNERGANLSQRKGGSVLAVSRSEEGPGRWKFAHDTLRRNLMSAISKKEKPFIPELVPPAVRHNAMSLHPEMMSSGYSTIGHRTRDSTKSSTSTIAVSGPASNSDPPPREPIKRGVAQGKSFAPRLPPKTKPTPKPSLNSAVILQHRVGNTSSLFGSPDSASVPSVVVALQQPAEMRLERTADVTRKGGDSQVHVLSKSELKEWERWLRSRAAGKADSAHHVWSEKRARHSGDEADAEEEDTDEAKAVSRKKPHVEISKVS